MEFSILGPLAVRMDGLDVAPTAGKPRALLVRLLVAGGRPVTADRLVEDLWDGDPPRSGAQTLQTYVLQLRKSIGADRVVTDGGGYRVIVGDGELDAAVFEARTASAREAAARNATSEAMRALEEALSLWRGPPLADAGGAAWAQGEAARLEELRLVAQELQLELKLAAGRHAEVIAPAEAAVAEHPLRERLWAHLITALYRQGRQADALRAFQRLRGHLADELGIDPSPELRELEQAVLEQDPRLAEARPAPESLGSAPPALPSGLVTFLLTDVVGSTRLWDTQPKLMPDALILHDGAIRDAIETHSGVVLKARGEGDSIFAVFRRATDAAHAAVAAQRTLASLDWPEGCVLPVRMAVHTGEALERDGDYYGPTVNRAARLRSLAHSGQVIVSHATADVIVDHLGSDIRLVELGRHQLRDLERPETVYLLVDAGNLEPPRAAAALDAATSALRKPSPLPSALAASDPFVGRERELERLAAEWQRVEQGAPRVVMIGGEPGVGKTRLAAEIARRAHDAGAIVLYGRCDEDLGAPYQPFAEALRTLLPRLHESVLRAVRGAEELARLVPEMEELVPDLRAPTRGDPDTERYALFDTVARVLVAVSKDNPVLVVLDDLHWAAKPTLLMLRHVLRFGEGAHVQLVGTYRTTELDPNHPLPGTLADLHRDGGVERIVLTGLAERDVGALLGATGHDDDELAKTLSTVTSGNPFFVIEVLRHVDESGGRWDPNTLPQGVREAVGRRLARLREETRAALLAGAVAGARFSLELVEEVLGRDLVDEAAEACDAGILVEESRGHFRFNHALVRQSLLTGVASVKRVRLHQRVAQTLEAAGAGSDERLADLAHHYFESAWAGNAAKAVEYCRRAADQAMARLAYEGAAELYERSLQALDVDDPAGDIPLRAELLLARCEAHLASGDATGAVRALADLEASAAGSRALAAWVVCFEAQLAALTRPDQLDAVERRVASAAEEFAALGDDAGEAMAHNTRASCLARLGRFAEGERALDRALTAARRSADAADHRRVNAVLAGAPEAALWGPSGVAMAGGRCLDVIRLVRITTGSPAVEATSIRCQAMLEALRGRERAARRMLESTRETLAELGLRHALLGVDLYEGMVDLLADDPETAGFHLRRAYDGLSRMGLDSDAAEAAALLARARLSLGDTSEADRLCEESERLGGQDLRASIAWRTVRAELLARRGEHRRAREVAEAAVALADPTDALVDQGDAYFALARVLDAAGDHEAATGAANRAIVRYERKGASALVERARRFLGSRALAGDRRAPESPPWLNSEAFVALTRRLNEILATAAWEQVTDVVDADVSWEYRGRLRLTESFSGVAAFTELVRMVAERWGYTASVQRLVATRGSLLALVHSTPLLGDDQRDHPGDGALRVLQLAANGRLVRDVVFDASDLDAAYAELDDRYRRTQGIEQADVFGTITQAIDAYNRRDPSNAPMSADLAAIDHRATAVAPDGGPAMWVAFGEAIAHLPNSRLRLAAVHALDAHGAVVTTIHTGSTRDGSDLEAAFHAVHVIEDKLITRVELFPESELDAAIARFRDLRDDGPVPGEPENRASPVASHEDRAVERYDGLSVDADVSVGSVGSNVATEVWARYHHACARRDWATVEAILTPEMMLDDRRAHLQWHGAAAVMDVVRGVADIGTTRFDSTTLATRASRLALTRTRGSGREPGAGAPAMEVLDVVEVDRQGRLVASVHFDADELEGAFAELNARYVTGEGARFRSTVGPYFELLDARLRDPVHSIDLLADEVIFVDHRAASLGVIEGREGFAAALQPRWSVRHDVLAIEAIADGVVLALLRTIGASDEGLPVEWRLWTLCALSDGLVARIEIFDLADPPSARAAFEALRPPSGASALTENLAARSTLRLLEACTRCDWAAAEALLAEDVIGGDMRTLNRHTERGRERALASYRFGAEMGVTRYEMTPIATRGDRLVLAHLWCGSTHGGDAPVVEFLQIVETDRSGVIIATLALDLASRDAAFAELDRRYLAGDGGPNASTMVAVLESVDRLPRDAGRRSERSAPLGDHSRARVVAVERLEQGVALVLVTVADESDHDASVESLFYQLSVVDDGVTTRTEVFDVHDLDRAVARFEELRPPRASPISGNRAAASFSSLLAACLRGDWDTAGALLAEDVRGPDHRSGVPFGSEGREAWIANARFGIEHGVTRWDATTIATRGDRLVLLTWMIAGRAGEIVFHMLHLVETDDGGVITTTVAFDADDLDNAFAELDRRYLAGDGAPCAEAVQAMQVVLEARADRSGTWDRVDALLADDVTLVDRRRASIRTVHGRAAFLDALRLVAPERVRVASVERTGTDTVLALVGVARASTTDPLAGARGYVLCQVESGRMKRYELFDADDLEDAVARFEELAGSPSVTENTAARSQRRFYSYVLESRWAEAEGLLAEDIVYDDRRAVVKVTTHGRAALMEQGRLSNAVGFRRGDMTVVATRGDRLVLSRVTATTDDPEQGAPENVSLFLAEVESSGRLITVIGFDVDGVEAAYAELEARYAAGEATPAAET